ncbi:MAG: ATP-binding protein [Bacteroidaceae bacterium]|nr:ATP-binding protein [Bacteroidaceae bacterium]
MDKNLFIGRDYEIRQLEKYRNSKESEFVIVYGRRRVGKTFLVKEFFDDTYDFKVTGLYKKNKKTQLKNFYLALQEYGSSVKTIPSDWLEAFAELKKLIKSIKEDRKKIIFIDELPWLDTRQSDFIAAFEGFWNDWGAQQNDLMLIACGSATTWITNKLLSDKGGLFNRAARRLYLMPFTLQETERYLLSRGIRWSRYDIVECYMVMGGIPYYLKLIDNELSYLANIDTIFFKRNGSLWDEFDHLYETLFGTSKGYLKIIEALSNKKSGLTRNEIIRDAKLEDNGLLTEMLKNLKDSLFVRAYNTYGYEDKNVVYQLSDYFTLFYLRFMKGKQNPDEHFWTHFLDNPAKKGWAGQTFEQVCKDHIAQVKKAIGISALLTDVSSWYGASDSGKAQIDLIIDRRDRTTNICEIKFSVNEFVIDKEYEEKLKKKMAVFREVTKSNNALQLVMITTYGVRQNAHSGIMQSQVKMDDLFINKD